MRRQASSWIESVKLQSSISGKREVSEKTGEALQVTSTTILKTMQIQNCRECGSANTSKRQPSKAPTSMSFLKSCSRWRRRRCSRCSRSRTRRRRRRNAASCNQRQRSLRPLLHSSLNFTNPSSKLFLVCPQSLF